MAHDIISTNNLINVPAMLAAFGNVTSHWRADMEILTHKQSGIYEIRNTVNGHIYVGSAIDLKQRWYDHRKLLRVNKHHSKYLQNAWNKYGESAFIFVVLRYIKSKDDLITNEQEFIDKLNPDYNVCRVAGSTLGKKQPAHVGRAVGVANSQRVITDEYRQKMSRSTLGKIVSEETKNRMSFAYKLRASLGWKPKNTVKIFQYTVDGDFICEYESVAEAARKTGLKDTHISRCARGKRKTTGGYVWQYAEVNNV